MTPSGSLGSAIRNKADIKNKLNSFRATAAQRGSTNRSRLFKGRSGSYAACRQRVRQSDLEEVRPRLLSLAISATAFPEWRDSYTGLEGSQRPLESQLAPK